MSSTDLLLDVRLPPKSLKKLEHLRSLADDALQLTRAATEQQFAVRPQLQAAEARLAELLRPQPQLERPAAYEIGRGYGQHSAVTMIKALAEGDPRVVAAQRELALLKDKLDRATQLYETRNATWTSAGRLVAQLENYLANIAGPIAGYPTEIEVPVKKGQTLLDAIEQRRRRCRELKADARQVQAAPIPSGEAKEKVRVLIASLAERGQPRGLGLLVETGSMAEIAAPTQQVQTTGYASGGGVTSNVFEQPDLLAFAAWLDPAKLLKKFCAEIDEFSDDEHALTDEQRTAKLEEIVADLLAVQREEEALIAQSESQGQVISRRTNADARAVLGLSDDLPAPEE